MQQQLNTPEELRAIREAMDEGKNPLVATDVPRWEDQVGISRIVNRRCLNSRCFPRRRRCWGTCRSAIRRKRSSPIHAMRFVPACTARTIDCW